jgi:type II secretory pathway pseudopilin PulG
LTNRLSRHIMSSQPIGKLMNLTKSSQSGQSLIETIVAIFILVTALIAGVGLALYAVANASTNRNQIVANNLAREGIEVFRMMRDSNWLAAQDDPQILDLTNCTYPNPPPDDVRPCYPETFARSGGGGSQFVFDPNSTHIFRFSNGEWSQNQAIMYTYILCQQADGSFDHALNPAFGSPCAIPTRYARSITVQAGDTSPPYTPASTNPTAAAGHSPEIVVQSTVVWQGRNCTPFPTSAFILLTFHPETFVTKCKVQISEHLTNWKDYQ